MPQLLISNAKGMKFTGYFRKSITSDLFALISMSTQPVLFLSSFNLWQSTYERNSYLKYASTVHSNMHFGITILTSIIYFIYILVATTIWTDLSNRAIACVGVCLTTQMKLTCAHHDFLLKKKENLQAIS